VANFALVLILFHGGFGTRRDDLKAVALPAGGMATWGVILTAAFTFGILHGLLGWDREKALLLGVIISSTDAAAIFSILRRRPLAPRLSSTLEIESAANDPMAILLTVLVVEGMTSSQAPWWGITLSLLWKFTAAPLLGWLMARGSIRLYNSLEPQDRGHYYVLSLGVILLIYGLSELIHTSGMLAVFVAGYVMGNRSFVHKQGVANFTSALATTANIVMFAVMGLQVFPSQWAGLWKPGIVLFLVLTFLARPLAVALGTLGMRIAWREKAMIMWAGLRGAVPIILATYPAAAGLAIGQEIFNLVFFAVLLSVLIQGSSLDLVARWLKLTVPSRPKPLFNLELITMAASDYDLMVVDLPDPQGAPGPLVGELRLPQGSVITLVTRGKEVIVPKGSTRLYGWDHVTVLTHAQDEEAVRSALLEPFRQDPSAP
jgi:cell volume regulation protein A